MLPKICSITECSKPHLARGWCTAHYSRWRKHGDPLLGGISRPKGSVHSIFWSRVDKGGTCWNWTGAPSDNGYGQIRFKGKRYGAHRLSWEIHNGPIPVGLYVDHRCHNKICVNPSHLRLASHKQNSENHQGARSDSSTGVRGVYMNAKGDRYVTQVAHNLQRYTAGTFDTLGEAKKAVIALRNELFTYNDVDRIKK